VHPAIRPETPAQPATRRNRRRGIATLALCAVFVTGLASSNSARPQDARGARACGATLEPAEVLRRLNAVRNQGAACHKSDGVVVGAPLLWSERLAAVAAAQSRDMATLKQMRHRDTLDRALGERLAVGGYRFSTAVENIAVGYASVDEVVAAWLDSAHHCVNIMNGKVVELGLACSDDASLPVAGEGRYWTLVLGAPPAPPR
jgi:uncharacterized protein YkwD